MRKLCYVIKNERLHHAKIFLLRCQLLYYLFHLRYFHKLYIHLKRISCRIEWFLFQLHSPKHARAIIIILLMIRKAIILVLRSQGDKNGLPGHTTLVANCKRPVSLWRSFFVIVLRSTMPLGESFRLASLSLGRCS